MMKKEQINIRDPFVVYEDGIYYMYGTRAKNFGRRVGGVDVYLSRDLEEWSDPIECFNSVKYGMNDMVNWAPEVHTYHGKYYMFITCTRKNGRRGTYSLVSDSLLGPFVPHSADALTPEEWECLDGTLYISRNGEPYLVFCHEHIQIIDGTMCYVRLNDDLSAAVGEVVTMFRATESGWAEPEPVEGHFVTDGPFLYRSVNGTLFMIWSTFIQGKYAECLLSFTDGELGLSFTHRPPLIDSDGGHGMIFTDGKQRYFTYHTPNTSGEEHPAFCVLEDDGDTLRLC